MIEPVLSNYLLFLEAIAQKAERWSDLRKTPMGDVSGGGAVIQSRLDLDKAVKDLKDYRLGLINQRIDT